MNAQTMHAPAQKIADSPQIMTFLRQNKKAGKHRSYVEQGQFRSKLVTGHLRPPPSPAFPL